MSATRQVRAVAVPRVVWAFPDLRRWTFRAAAFVFCLASALLLTALRLEITRSGYDLSNLYDRRQALTAEVARLKVEAASLAHPRRIEEEARKLGYIHPDRDSIVVLDE